MSSDRADEHRPLSGVRVVELSGIGPAPLASMMLADMGATVVSVDRPRYANPTPGYRPELDAVRRGRYSIGLDLKTPGGRSVFERLLDAADVLVDPYRPGALGRLGFGPTELRKRHPRLVLVQLTGWGQTGPLSQQPGHDITYLALTGALDAIGREGEPPIAPLNLVGDYAGGSLFAVIGILAALRSREATGEGQVVDAAIVDGASLMMTLFAGYREMGIWHEQRGTNLIDTGAPFYDTYECADGRYVAVGAVEPEYYASFVRVLGFDPWSLPPQMDEASWPHLRQMFASRFRQRSRDEWAAVFDGAGACCAPVLSLSEVAHHPHHESRRSFFSVGGVTVPAPAPRFSTPSERSGDVIPPSLPGRDTAQVLRALGYDDVAIAALARDGSVFVSSSEEEGR